MQLVCGCFLHEWKIVSDESSHDLLKLLQQTAFRLKMVPNLDE